MKSTPLLFALSLCVAPLASNAQTCPAQSAEEAAADVHSSFAAWQQAVEHRDLEKTMAIFSASLRFQYQGVPDFGYDHLLAVYQAEFSRPDAPIWRPNIENTIASPTLVTLFGEWTLMPAKGGDAITRNRGVDVFQREADCVWRVVASLNYSDKRSVAVDSQDRRSPAEVKHDKLQPSRAGAIARVDRQQ
ncbi:MAG TPA: nuclear transport factor 2 family protein [Rudaea sp.]|nr:nuclear transport factor 2 family protein [Rudaea sp.]